MIKKKVFAVVCGLLAMHNAFVLTQVQKSECRTVHQNKENGTMTFHKNIFELAKQNTFFRKELVTGKFSQVVLMSIPVGGEIGMEKHTVDQTLVFVAGQGQAIVNGEKSDVQAGYLVFVPAGVQHNFKNTGPDELKLFTLYAPSEHAVGTLEKTKI
jgi:mannose-6-phosphate isomerase-like protein (cupin superfamily)